LICTIALVNCASIRITSIGRTASRPSPTEPDRDRIFDVVITVINLVEDRIGTDLPDHQRRGLRDDVALETRQFFRGLLAADAAVRDVDQAAVEPRPQRLFETVRERHDPVRASGRRRADGDDLDPALPPEGFGQMRKPVLEAHEVGMEPGLYLGHLIFPRNTI
jgi:hypothetical protein